MSDTRLTNARPAQRCEPNGMGLEEQTVPLITRGPRTGLGSTVDRCRKDPGDRTPKVAVLCQPSLLPYSGSGVGI
jgi:hypothetical protein